MTLNLTINEASGTTPSSTPGTYNVRAKYTETDAGHVFGPFSTREKAEECLVTLSARTGVITAEIEVV